MTTNATIAHRQRRQDALDAIRRLTEERAALSADEVGVPDAIAAAEALAAGSDAAVSLVEIELAEKMNASPGLAFPALRQQLADARERRVEARSNLDRLIRCANERRRRLADIEVDIAGWRRRVAQADIALREQR